MMIPLDLSVSAFLMTAPLGIQLSLYCLKTNNLGKDGNLSQDPLRHILSTNKSIAHFLKDSGKMRDFPSLVARKLNMY